MVGALVASPLPENEPSLPERYHRTPADCAENAASAAGPRPGRREPAAVEGRTGRLIEDNPAAFDSPNARRAALPTLTNQRHQLGDIYQLSAEDARA